MAKTFKIELAVLAIALGVGGVFWAMSSDALEEEGTVAVSTFTQGDYALFDRNFEVSGQVCEVGLKAHKMCFGRSPLESQLKIGVPLPIKAPAISAEFRVIVDTALKSPELQTIRYGSTLALIDPETRVVKDILHLDAPEYDSARAALTEPIV
jgi:hypothetical protein